MGHVHSYLVSAARLQLHRNAGMVAKALHYPIMGDRGFTAMGHNHLSGFMAQTEHRRGLRGIGRPDNGGSAQRCLRSR